MHVLMLTPGYPPLPGGGERYAQALAGRLAQQGIDVTVVTSQATRERDLWVGTARTVTHHVEDNVTVIRCPLRPFPGGWNGLLAYRKLMVLLSLLPGNQARPLQTMARLIPPLHNLLPTVTALSGPFDLVHGFNISWEYALLTGWQYARQHGRPFVATPFMHFGTGNDRVARNSTMDHQVAMLKTAVRLLVLTELEREGLSALGISAEKIVVVGGGVDLPPLLPTITPPPTPYVIFVGRASYDKGAIHAAQATLALRQQGTAVSLMLVGQTTPEFDRFYRQLDPEQQAGIRPLGIVSDEQKQALLHHAACLVLPSRTDSFGIVLLEAWAHGIPVVGARAGGIPAVVDDEQNGLIVPFADVPALTQALSRLLADPTGRHKLGACGLMKVQQVYNWDAVATRVVEQYRGLLRDKHT